MAPSRPQADKAREYYEQSHLVNGGYSTADNPAHAVGR